MKTRILIHWKTTLLGLFLLLTAITVLSLRLLSGGEFIALLPTIIGLLLAPDTLFKSKV